MLLWQFYLFHTIVIQVNEYLFHNFGYTLSEAIWNKVYFSFSLLPLESSKLSHLLDSTELYLFLLFTKATFYITYYIFNKAKLTLLFGSHSPTSCQLSPQFFLTH